MVSSTNNFSINSSFHLMGSNLNCCEINGSDFIIFDQEIQSENDLKIELSNCNIIFLSPINSQENITIKAISVIALSSITAKGSIKINASKKFISLGHNLNRCLAYQINVPLMIQVEAGDGQKTILNSFKEGVDNWKGQAVVQGLVNIYSAIITLQGRDLDPAHDLANTLSFFNIPPTSPI